MKAKAQKAHELIVQGEARRRLVKVNGIAKVFELVASSGKRLSTETIIDLGPGAKPTVKNT